MCHHRKALGGLQVEPVVERLHADIDVADHHAVSDNGDLDLDGIQQSGAQLVSCVDKLVGRRPLVERKEALELVVEERVDAIATARWDVDVQRVLGGHSITLTVVVVVHEELGEIDLVTSGVENSVFKVFEHEDGIVGNATQGSGDTRIDVGDLSVLHLSSCLFCCLREVERYVYELYIVSNFIGLPIKTLGSTIQNPRVDESK